MNKPQMQMTNLLPTYHHPLSNGLCYEMVLVKAGYFIMGDDNDGPEHIVELTHDFYMGKYPVTQAIWKEVMAGHNPSRFEGEDRPVEKVSWRDIMEGGQDEQVVDSFIGQLSKNYSIKEEDIKDWQFRLPSEAEWEYSAKGGHLSPQFDLDHPPKARELYTAYAGGDKLKQVGWYNANSHIEPKEVGKLRSNKLGLFDMSGNVREWCLDYYNSDFYRKCKEQGIVQNPLCRNGLGRVGRGGSWFNDAQDCRVSYRNNWPPTFRSYVIGFRLVLAPSSVEWSKQV